jgi:tRNA nucleotidyltransferase (CCA-adding enzyme)
MWVVGGSVRDALDGRAFAELDLAVSHDGAGLAAAAEAAGVGKAVPLSDASPVVFRIAGANDIDCAEIEGGSIESDMARRDFTVNAIAFDPESREWVDPFGGAADLARRRLRLISAANFADDPLRALRVVRFMATHELRPDPQTLRATRDVAALLRDVAPERIRVELVKTLRASRARKAIEVLIRTGLLEPALRIRTARHLRRALLRKLDSPAISRLSPDNRLRLRLALLAEALRLSPDRASRWLADLRFSREECAGTGALLSLAHRVPALATSRDEWSWIRDAGRDRALALWLFSLLHSGPTTLSKRLARRRPRRGRLRVGGRDLMVWLGIGPGPRIGELLRDLEIQWMSGAIRSRRAARQWLVKRQQNEADRPKPGKRSLAPSRETGPR